MSKGKAILVDVDGTVAIHDGRGPFDWSKLSEDSPNHAVIDVVNRIGLSDVLLIFITGRENRYGIETENWLKKHIVCPFILYCRTDNDFRKDEEIKKEIYEEKIKAKFEVIGVFDDRNRVVSMWREKLGLVCFQVAEGDF